ncbi:hypothetical protein [Streptomyces sp. NPDC093795]|uniref:hypothetical protein n=1 Tax=Streptomyces sp. NPDC093795 TaxID=3366051 RepID=UPI00381C266F
MSVHRPQEPLTVGGTGRGALAARYALASAELNRMGGRPRRPRLLRLLDSGVTDGLTDDDVDESTSGEAETGGPLLSKEYGSWLLDRLM